MTIVMTIIMTILMTIPWALGRTCCSVSVFGPCQSLVREQVGAVGFCKKGPSLGWVGGGGGGGGWGRRATTTHRRIICHKRTVNAYVASSVLNISISLSVTLSLGWSATSQCHSQTKIDSASIISMMRLSLTWSRILLCVWSQVRTNQSMRALLHAFAFVRLLPSPSVSTLRPHRREKGVPNMFGQFSTQSLLLFWDCVTWSIFGGIVALRDVGVVFVRSIFFLICANCFCWRRSRKCVSWICRRLFVVYVGCAFVNVLIPPTICQLDFLSDHANNV